jgi:hypothetical protein
MSKGTRLSLVSFVAGVFMWIIPKTPYSIIPSLIIIYFVMIYLLWDLPQIAKSLKLQLGSLIVMAIILFGIGYISWPEKQQPIPTAEEIAKEVVKRLPTPKENKTPIIKTEQPKQAIAEEMKKEVTKEKRGKIGEDSNPTPPSTTIIIRLLQITPLDIEERPWETIISFDILNYSDYVANNILVDVKFGNSLWARELWKSSAIDNENKRLKEKNNPLIAEILSHISEQEQKKMLKNFLNLPTYPKLIPGAKIGLFMGDMNKDWILKQEFFSVSGGKSTPIEPQKSLEYQTSLGWKEQIDNTESGKPIKISLYVSWENEIGKKIDKVIEYHLICTKFGTGRSFKFLPTGNIIKNYE